MPAVRESDVTEEPEVLEIVEVRPGVRLKLNKADRKAWEDHNAAAQKAQSAFEAANAPAEPEEAGEEPVAYADLQARAKELGIPSGQSRIKLEKAIAAAEEEG